MVAPFPFALSQPTMGPCFILSFGTLGIAAIPRVGLGHWTVFVRKRDERNWWMTDLRGLVASSLSSFIKGGSGGSLAAPAVASHPNAASSAAADWRAVVTAGLLGGS